MKLATIAKKLKDDKKNIILIYAFNATGKTRLSVEYKNITKTDGEHTGVYYNAFSEDIFVWDNDIENNEKNIRLTLNFTSLNKFHNALTEDALHKNLQPFNPKYKFNFVPYSDPKKGIECINFSNEHQNNIKISRGEERIFIWCFFLTLFETGGLSESQSKHFFVDDPVSSLDDYNLFVTASSLYNLLKKDHENRKFIITTHHFGFFSVLYNWLCKGGKRNKFKKSVRPYILTNKSGKLELKNAEKDVLLFHLYLMQILKETKKKEIQRYHFAILRQLLENISSFLGAGNFSHVLKQIDIGDANQLASVINALSHQNVYQYQSKNIEEWELKLFKDVLEKIKEKYNFILHTG